VGTIDEPKLPREARVGRAAADVDALRRIEAMAMD